MDKRDVFKSVVDEMDDDLSKEEDLHEKGAHKELREVLFGDNVRRSR